MLRHRYASDDIEWIDLTEPPRTERTNRMAIEIVSYKPINRGTLKGFVTFRMTNIGLEINSAMLNEKDGKRWIGLPAKPYQKQDGSTGWQPLLSFYDRGMENKFRSAALKALDIYLAGPQDDDEEPF